MSVLQTGVRFKFYAGANLAPWDRVVGPRNLMKPDAFGGARFSRAPGRPGLNESVTPNHLENRPCIRKPAVRPYPPLFRPQSFHRIRQRLQNNAVDHAENRAIGPDAERQRDGRNHCKHRRAAESTENMPEAHRIA